MYSILSTCLDALSLHVGRKPRIYGCTAGVLFLLFASSMFLLPPVGFPTNEIIEIKEGTSFTQTAHMLEEKNVVQSAFFFRIFARITGADSRIQAGSYTFSAPAGVATTLYRFTHGITGIPTIKVTFPEGSSIREMVHILEEEIPDFDTETFLLLSKEKEGYLFPDTYLLNKAITPKELVRLLEARFSEQVKKLSLPEEEIPELVIYASLIEKEANTPEDRRIISGILRTRVSIEMPLQVDAVFGYIQGRGTYHPSGEDLEIDSPYNTYRYTGLPPGPITNPGFDALEAAAEPTQTQYLYYLTGRDGNMYYAETFEEHKQNKALYLR